jgi:hypothetical protein
MCVVLCRVFDQNLIYTSISVYNFINSSNASFFLLQATHLVWLDSRIHTSYILKKARILERILLLEEKDGGAIRPIGQGV